MAIGNPPPHCFRRYANLAFGPTGHSLPESMATLADRAQLQAAWFLVGLVTPPQPFAEAERKASPNGLSIIRFPANCLRPKTGFSVVPRPAQGLGVSSRKR